MPSASGLDALSRAVYEVRAGRGITAHVDGGRLFVENNIDDSAPCKVVQTGPMAVSVRIPRFFTRDGMVDANDQYYPKTLSIACNPSNNDTIIFCRYSLQDDEWETQAYGSSDWELLTTTDFANFYTNVVSEDGYYVVPVALVQHTGGESITGVYQFFTGHPSYITPKTGTVNMVFTDPDTVGDVDNWPGWEVLASMEDYIPAGYNRTSGGVFGVALNVGDTYGEIDHGFAASVSGFYHGVSLNNNTVMVDNNADGSTVAVPSVTTVPTDVSEAKHIPPVRVVCWITKL